MDDTGSAGLAPTLHENVRPVDGRGHLDVGGERYAQLAKLGEGGMGEVLLCADRNIGRDVALKVARDDESSAARRRFLREARIQAQLEHPSVVPVYDIGQ